MAQRKVEEIFEADFLSKSFKPKELIKRLKVCIQMGSVVLGDKWEHV